MAFFAALAALPSAGAAAAEVGGGLAAIETAGAGAAALGATIGTTVAEAASIASGASSLYTMTRKPKAQTPPMPTTDQASIDTKQQQAEQEARKRAAGGMESTVGTPGGQAGSILNPATVSQNTLLGG